MWHCQDMAAATLWAVQCSWRVNQSGDLLLESDKNLKPYMSFVIWKICCYCAKCLALRFWENSGVIVGVFALPQTSEASSAIRTNWVSGQALPWEMTNLQDGRKNLQVDFYICFLNILKFVHFWGWFMVILENELSRTGKKDSFVQNICLTKPPFFFPICSLKLRLLTCLNGNIRNCCTFLVFLLAVNYDIHICIGEISLIQVFRPIRSFRDWFMKSNQKFWDTDIVWKFGGEFFNFPFHFDDGLVVLNSPVKQWL